FGWVCFSNPHFLFSPTFAPPTGLNCLSAGSVSLTSMFLHCLETVQGLNCLSAGSVSLTKGERARQADGWVHSLNCLSAGSVSLTYSTTPYSSVRIRVSIAFRLGLFL